MAKKKKKKINKLPTKENPGPEVSQGKFYQMFKEDLAPNPLQALPKIRGRNTSQLLLRSQVLGTNTRERQRKGDYRPTSHEYTRASLAAQLLKNPPAMQQTWVRSLGLEDRLKTGKATHSSIPVWRIPWAIQSMGSQSVGHD